MEGKEFLSQYPAPSTLVTIFDEFLKNEYPDCFGSEARHPLLPLKRSKILHDNIWGTNKYSWRELAIIDSPLFQRLRDIHQVGLAYQVYMCARHTRFEHCLGVVTTASRIFDSLINRQKSIANIVQSLEPDDPRALILRLRQELRLAALIHDLGHCIHSHTSEQVYEHLGIVKDASSQLTEFVGKEKGAAETIAFCLALTDSVSQLLERAEKKLVGEETSDDYKGKIDLINVALIIIGRASHPFLQFMGDIISSPFDADKIDYIMRDSVYAGLPLRFDFDRFLYSLEIEQTILADGEGKLKALYDLVSEKKPELQAPSGDNERHHYFAYKLGLPERAMNTVEQIVICKLMLYNYIYHHQKVRASEGMLRRMLERIYNRWITEGKNDKEILLIFLSLTDSALYGTLKEEAKASGIGEYPYRIINRLLPREIYCLNGAVGNHAEGAILRDFITDLQGREKRRVLVDDLEREIGKELLELKPGLGNNAEDALFKAGVWVDIPKPPRFENIDKIIIRKRNQESSVPFGKVFPIRAWTDAYEHYRYPVRIYSFSEYSDETKIAAEKAMRKVIKIEGSEFYKGVCRDRNLS